MENSKDCETITFVNRVKSRINRILDGRKSCLNKSSEYMKYIGYLSDISISYEVLKQTHIGQTLRLLRKIDGEIGQLASELISRWKRELKLVDNSVDRFIIEENDQCISGNFLCDTDSMNCRDDSKVLINDLNFDLPPMPTPLKCTKRLTMPSLPEINLPILQSKPLEIPNFLKTTRRVRCPSNSFQQFVSNNSRTKVYSGSTAFKANTFSLHELCLRSLEININLVDKFTIGFPVIRPLLERILPHDLARLESANQYIQQSTGFIWERHCIRTFKDNLVVSNQQNWKENYFMLMRKKDERLKSLSSKISAKQAEKKPSSSVISLNMPKTPRNRISRKIFRTFKEDDNKFTPLMKKTIKQFKERKQMYKSKPIRYKF